MSRSCQSATFSSPTSAFARTTRARPQIRSAVIGFRLCGIADDPFWPRANGSSTSRTSVRARCRISVANRSSDEASSASADSSSAWRSRWRICVELGAGSSPSRSHAIRSTSGSIAAYWPTAPDSFPTRIPATARSIRVSVAVESERPPGELQPECRRLGMDAVRAAHAERVPMLLGPVDDGAKRAIEPFENERPGVLDGEGEGRVEHVGRRQAEVEPAPVLAQRPGDGVDERGDVVVRLPLELGHASRRRRLRHRPDARGGVSGHHAELAPALECRELDLEHPGEPRLVRPDLGHGGTGVASDHAVILEAASERRSVTKLVQCRHTLVTHCCPFRR